MIDETKWREDSKWESQWRGNCINTVREELLQFAYAKRMGLQAVHDGRSPYNIDMDGKTVMDIGGGPISLLLKCKNVGRGIVVDPCEFPKWVLDRYKCAGVNYLRVPAETLTAVEPFDEVWIYNVLQHTMDPKLIVENALKAADIVRVFEWIDAGISPGHPHELHEAELNEWFHGEGIVEKINEHGAVGKCYYGAFTK